jgi:hypothetical protein
LVKLPSKENLFDVLGIRKESFGEIIDPKI